MRWSPWESIVPPRRPPVPSIDHAVRRSPRPRRRARAGPSVTVAIRSDSLRRSSAASRIVVVPSAKQAARATSGSSSIASGTSAPPTSVAAQRPSGAHAEVADRLAAAARRSARPRSSAPIRSRIVSRPVRVGLSADPVRTTSLPGTSSAATRKKAAEEKSAGTTIAARLEPLGRAYDDARASPSRRDRRRRRRRACARCGRGSAAARPPASRPRPAGRRRAGTT